MDDLAAVVPADNGAGHESVIEEPMKAAQVRSKLRIQLAPRGNVNLKRLSSKMPMKNGEDRSGHSDSRATTTKNAGYKSARAASKMARISIGKILRSFLASVETLATDQDDFKADGEAEMPSDRIQFAGYLAAVKATIDAEPNTDFSLDKMDALKSSVTLADAGPNPDVPVENDAKGVEPEKLPTSSQSKVPDDESESKHEAESETSVPGANIIPEDNEKVVHDESLSEAQTEHTAAADPDVACQGGPKESDVSEGPVLPEKPSEEIISEAADTLADVPVDLDQRDDEQQPLLEETRAPVPRWGRPRRSESRSVEAESSQHNLPPTKKERHDDLSVSESEQIGLDAETPAPRRGPPRKLESVESLEEQAARHRQSESQSEKVERKRRGRPPKRASLVKVNQGKSSGVLKDRKHGRSSGKFKDSHDATNDAALEDIRAIEELSAAAREAMARELLKTKRASSEADKPRRGRAPKKDKISTALSEKQVAEETATTSRLTKHQIPELTRDFLSSDSQITVESDATQEIYVTSIGEGRKSYEGLDVDTTVEGHGTGPDANVRKVQRGRPRKGENRQAKRTEPNLAAGEAQALRRGRSLKSLAEEEASSVAVPGVSENDHIQMTTEPLRGREDNVEVMPSLVKDTDAEQVETSERRSRPKKSTTEDDVNRVNEAGNTQSEERGKDVDSEPVKRKVGRPRKSDKSTKESRIKPTSGMTDGRPSRSRLDASVGRVSEPETDKDRAAAPESTTPKRRGRPLRKSVDPHAESETEVDDDKKPSPATAPKRRGRLARKSENASAGSDAEPNNNAERASTAVAIVPRRRGRPPKMRVSTSADEHPLAVKTEPEDTKNVPRTGAVTPTRRGRQSKNVTPGVDTPTTIPNRDTPASSVEVQPHKRRGRPPKNKQSLVDTAATDSGDSAAPTRRGRSSQADEESERTASPSKDESPAAPDSELNVDGNEGTSAAADRSETTDDNEIAVPRRRGRPPLSEEVKQARLAQKLAPKGRGKKNVLKVSLPFPIRPRSERATEDKRDDESATETAMPSQVDESEDGSVAALDSPPDGSPLRTTNRSESCSLTGSPTLPGTPETGSGSPKRISDTRSPEIQTRKVTVKVVSKKQPVRVSRGSDTDTAEETLDEEEHLRQLEQKTARSAPSTPPAGDISPRSQPIAVTVGSPKQASHHVHHVQEGDNEPESKRQRTDEPFVPKVPLFEAPAIVQGKRERKRKVMDDFEDSLDLFARGATTSKTCDTEHDLGAPSVGAGPAGTGKKKPDVIVVSPPAVMSPPTSVPGVARSLAIGPKAPTPTVNVVVPSMAAPPIVVQPSAAGSAGTSQPLQVQIPTTQVTVSLPVQVQTSTSGTSRPMVITVPANGLRSPIGSGVMKTIVMNKVVHRPFIGTTGQPANIRLTGTTVQTNVPTTMLAGKTGGPRVQVVTARPPDVKMLPCAVRSTGLTTGSPSTSMSSGTVVMRAGTPGSSTTTSTPVPRVVTATVRPSIIRGPRIITSVSRPGAPRLLAPAGATTQGQPRLITMRPSIGQPGSMQTLRQGTVTILPTGGKLVVRTVSPSGSLVPQRPIVQQRQITVQATPSPPPPTTVVFTPGAAPAKTTTPILVTRSPTIFTRPLATTVRSIGPPKFAHPPKPPLEKVLPSSTMATPSNTATIVADQYPGQQLVTVHRRQPIQAQVPKTTVERTQPPLKKPLVQQVRKPSGVKILPSPIASVPVAPVAPLQAKPVDEAASAVEKLLLEPELPQPKLSKKPLTKKQKSMRKTDLIKTSTRSRRRGTDLQIDYNEDRMGAIPGADSETDSQEGSPPSEELGSPEQPDDESGADQAPQDDIPVAVVEVFLSQDEVKLREVHSPTKQDLADISQQQQHPQQQSEPAASSLHIASSHSSQPHAAQQQATSTSTGGQDAPEGFFTTEEGFVTGEVPTIIETIANPSVVTTVQSKVCGGLISSNDNAFAKALMSSDEALIVRRKSVTNLAAGGTPVASSSKRKSNPMSRD